MAELAPLLVLVPDDVRLPLLVLPFKRDFVLLLVSGVVFEGDVDCLCTKAVEVEEQDEGCLHPLFVVDVAKEFVHDLQ